MAHRARMRRATSLASVAVGRRILAGRGLKRSSLHSRVVCCRGAGPVDVISEHCGSSLAWRTSHESCPLLPLFVLRVSPGFLGRKPTEWLLSDAAGYRSGVLFVCGVGADRGCLGRGRVLPSAPARDRPSGSGDVEDAVCRHGQRCMKCQSVAAAAIAIGTRWSRAVPIAALSRRWRVREAQARRASPAVPGRGPAGAFPALRGMTMVLIMRPSFGRVCTACR